MYNRDYIIYLFVESGRLTMERKLIAIDLDGTTLNNESKITPETFHVIQNVLKQGHIVSIATGRSYRKSFHLYDELQLQTPIVNYNGALSHFPGQDNWKYGYHKKLDLDLAFSLKTLNTEPDINLIAAETTERVYIDRTKEEYKSQHIPFQLIDATISPFDETNLIEDPTSVSVYTPLYENVPTLQDKILNQFGQKVAVQTWGGPTPTLEIVASGIQKAMGVESVAAYYDIKPKNILAFGDEANDYEMIQYAGHGVMMKNGIDDLKNVADDITEFSNDENGLAKYLKNYFKV